MFAKTQNDFPSTRVISQIVHIFPPVWTSVAKHAAPHNLIISHRLEPPTHPNIESFHFKTKLKMALTVEPISASERGFDKPMGDVITMSSTFVYSEWFEQYV